MESVKFIKKKKNCALATLRQTTIRIGLLPMHHCNEIKHPSADSAALAEPCKDEMIEGATQRGICAASSGVAGALLCLHVAPHPIRY